MRIVCFLQFSHSLLFAILGLGLLFYWRQSAVSIVIAYATVCLITSLGVIYFLHMGWRATPADYSVLSQRGLWSKLLPFAAWIWLTNLLTNLFAMADRWMIVHFGGGDSEAAAVMVGNYHSSCVVPILMVAIAGMFAGVILPHLSHDWERGRRVAVARRLNLILKGLGLALATGAAVILIASPLLFHSVFEEKYDGGLTVLPWTLVYCVWFSTCLVAQNYLWCTERAYLVSLVYGIGLLLNVCLNLMLLPVLGLLGAVLATTLSMGISLTLVYCLNRRNGMEIDAGTCAVTLLPIVLCIGTWQAAAVVLLMVPALVTGSWFFRDEEKQTLLNACFDVAKRIGWSR